MEQDELSEYLESLARDDCYRVDTLMSESAHEQTQRVYFLGANGAEIGPYIRKLIRRESGLGNAYRRIYDAQRSGRRFKHIPHVLECHEAGEDLVAVMELVRGESLAALVDRVGPSVDVACAVFPPLCDGVTELHGEFVPPIIHRDLKPSNVIVSWPSGPGEGGVDACCDVTLIDFDIARVKRDGPGADTVRFGTPAFAPPEQFGFAQTTERSDVHALGALLFFCLTGEVPDQDVRQRNWADPRVPEPVRCVIARAAAFDPDDRYASAEALKQAFRAAEAQIGCGAPKASDASERAEFAARLDADSAELVGAPPAKASDDAPRNGAKGKAPLAIVVGGVACVAVAAAVAFGVMGQGAITTASSAASGQSASAQASAGEDDSGSASSYDAADLEPLSQDEAAEGLQTPGVPKNGFDPATNFTVSTANVEFEVPSYFKMETGADDNGSSLYYAETGSSVAMILVRENPIDLPASREDFEEAKDDYVSSMIEAGGDILGEIVSSTDYELAGRAARVVTTSGKTPNGLVVTAKEVFFFEEDRNVVGAIMFGQTNNVQFDYSQDFAKVITSARDAGAQ